MKILAPKLEQWQSVQQPWIASVGDALRGDASRLSKSIAVDGGFANAVIRTIGGLLFVSVQIGAGLTCDGEEIKLPCSVEPGVLLLTDGSNVVGCVAVTGSSLSLPGRTWTENGYVVGTLAQQESN